MSEPQYNYTCPACSKDCTVSLSLTGQNLMCPSCSSEFYATPPNQIPPPIPSQVPEKLPFFKSGRKKILETKLNELVADGELDKGDERDLIYLSAQLGLKHEDLEELEKKRFLDEFVPIKQRIERTWQVSDVDLQDIERLEKKYDTRLTMSGENQIFRAIYLIESKGQLPPPVPTALMLNGNETAYYSLPSIWHQTRVRTRGYSGVSIGIPTGIKGVRFRFGGYSPIRSEELTSLSDGQLCITSKRVLFNGEIRSTTIDLKRVVDCEVFSDALKVEKSTGKPDYFSMSAAQARYITALIGALK